MLTFLAIASRKRLSLDSYHDDAVGVLDKDAGGRLAMTRVTLRPKVQFSGEKSRAQRRSLRCTNTPITRASSRTR